jgi:hypothetical protein
MPNTSGSLGSYIYGELNTPRTQLFEWNIREQSPPTHTRTIYGGHPAWVKELGVSVSKAMEFEDVVLNYADSSLSGRYPARTQCFTIGLADSDYSISNMRLWMPSGSALNSSGHLEFASSGLWIWNALLPSGQGTVVPSSLPTNMNIVRQDNQLAGLDYSEDTHVSQYVYLGLTIQSGMPLGQYGLGSNGHLALRVTYDWYYKFAPPGGLT